MSVEKELLVCRKKIELLSDLIRKERDRIDSLERSHYRDMRDRWQFSKDTGHPVTGNVSPEESSELLIVSLCKRDRGDS